MINDISRTPSCFKTQWSVSVFYLGMELTETHVVFGVNTSDSWHLIFQKIKLPSQIRSPVECLMTWIHFGILDYHFSPVKLFHLNVRMIKGWLKIIFQMKLLVWDSLLFMVTSIWLNNSVLVFIWSLKKTGWGKNRNVKWIILVLQKGEILGDILLLSWWGVSPSSEI